MLKYKCGNCGGEFEIHTHGELQCPFCGTKQYFSEAELAGYKGYRDNVLQYVRSCNDVLFEKGDVLHLWRDSDTAVFSSRDGEIEVSYTYRTEIDGIDTYINKSSVIYVFTADRSTAAADMLKNISLIKYPSADIKGLKNMLPQLKARYELKDDGVILAFEKSENVYPLFAFSQLHPKHVAWIISRLENISCLLEFNTLEHLHMDENNVFINPSSHEAFLYGGWWDLRPGSPKACLKGLRKTAQRICGFVTADAPAEFETFLESQPRDSAYEDFGYWDEVIEKGFGGHHFSEFGS